MRDWSREEFMTVAEVAGLLKLNQQTIRNWIDAGSLPAVRVGRRVRVLRSDFEALVDSGARSLPATTVDGVSAEGFWAGTCLPEAITPPRPSGR